MNTELLSGTCQHFLFSPKGAIEGLLLQAQGKTVQVTMPPEIGTALTGKTGLGKRLRLLAALDKSPKATAGDHPVYEFEAFGRRDGERRSPHGRHDRDERRCRPHPPLQARPAQWGVLETGKFIHPRPQGMAAIGLGVGAKLTAKGELRTTVLGTRMLEAHYANGYDIE